MNSCEHTGKISFVDERAALDELAKITVKAMTGARTRREHIETGVYACPHCPGWHLSSRPWNGSIVNRGRQRA